VKLLVLGGTAFAGRALVEAALARGHEPVLFNRGRTNPGLFPEVEQVHGDRDGELGRLDGRRFDAVVDTSGYVPRVVAASAAFASVAAERYCFVSSVSVYADLSVPGVAEDAPLAELADESVEEVTGETYGPLKALCERVVADALPGRALIVRPGLIVGPYDPTDRFTYWPERIARGGPVLVPGRPDRPLQFVDARDLAAWMLALIEDGSAGTFNAAGPEPRPTMGELFDVCRRAGGAGARPVWADDAFLFERGVGAWMELPLWLPEGGDHAGIFAIDASAARERGLGFRPLEQTVADTLAWTRTRPPGERRAGLAPEREAELLRELGEDAPSAKIAGLGG
jgi:2'-hydroxyisoflavone reductase